MNKKKTPLTSHRVRETVEELLELLSKRQNEVAALRSELSAAQEENKRLRAALEGFANEIKGNI
jgi:hypothetical protein